jgi:cell division inhibitor SepF
MSIFDKFLNIFVTPGADDVDDSESDFETENDYRHNNGNGNGPRRSHNHYNHSAYGGNVVDVPPEMPNYHSQNGVVKQQQQIQGEAVVIHPKCMEDAYNIGKHVTQNRLVIVDLTGLASEMARRIVDYLSGVSHTIDGSTVRINNNIFTISSPSYSVKDEVSRLSSNNHENEFGPTSFR